MAVLAVVAFHAFPGKLPGGFVGVDVFFVISGYLITGIVARGAASGTFSLSEFYARRAQRILPALVVVLVATLAIGALTMLPQELAGLGRHTVGGSAFASNLLLMGEGGYFDARSDEKPLLHLWSLAIEEQFYLVWPLVLMAGLRAGCPRATAAVLASTSFVAGAWMLERDAAQAYYAPQVRGWELLVGAGLALAPSARGEDGRDGASAWPRDAASVLGAALVAGAVALTSGDAPYPGWRALAPCVGTALLIAAGPTATVNRWALARPALVAIGLVSYPLYLWHWPLLAFAQLHVLDDVGSLRGLKLVAVAVAFVAAFATHRWVERPIARRAAGRVAVPALVSVGIVGVLGGAITWTGGLPSRLEPAAAALASQAAEEQRAEVEAYGEGTCLLAPDADASALSPACRPADSALVVWGDSYAAHLMPGLRALFGDARITQLTMSACAPVLPDGPDAPSVPAACAAFDAAIAASLTTTRPTTVLVAANWLGLARVEPAYARFARAAVEALVAAGHRVVLIGPPPTWHGSQPKIVLRAGLADTAENAQLPEIRAVDDALAAVATELAVPYVSPVRALCVGTRCRTLLSGAGAPRLFAWDAGHLTRAGSRWYAEELLMPALWSAQNQTQAADPR